MTPKLPGLLVRYIQEKRCVVFVGAGLSAGAGLPTWGELLRRGIEELGRSLPEGESHQEELQNLVDRGKLLEVAEFCREKLGAAYHQFLTEQVRGDRSSLPQTHHVLMHLPFSAWVTTNYDKLLERAYSEAMGGYPRTLTHKDTEQLGRLLFDGGQFILKAHGDIDRPETVVLTSRDYNEIIHANPAFNEAFSGLLLTKALFFVGYSLSDPDFRLLMDRQLTHFKGFVPERFALMMDVGPVERDVLWRTARIRVLSYDKGKHEQVLQFLESLKAAVLQRPASQQVEGGAKASVPAPAAAPAAPSPQVVSQNVSGSRSGEPRSFWASLGFSTAAAAPPPPARGPSPGTPALARMTGAPRPPSPMLEASSADDSELSREAEERSPPPAVVQHQTPPLPQPGAPTPQPAVVGPYILALEPLKGMVQFRLLGSGEVVAEGRGSMQLNMGVAMLLQRAHKEGKGTGLPTWFYTDLTQLFEEHGPRELFDALGERVPTSAPLVLHVSPLLARFPWEFLPSRGQAIGLRYNVVREPVGILAEVRGLPSVREAPRVLLIEGVEGARAVESIARQYEGALEFSCTVLKGPDATFARVQAELNAGLPDLLHFTGALGQEDGELHLKLPGDDVLSAGFLASILSGGRLPFLVVDAPSSAFAPPVSRTSNALFEGREGLMDLATQMGVGAFVGTFGKPGVQAGPAFMVALHRGLVMGLPIAEAVRHARQETLKEFPGDPTALQYILSGAGELQLWDSTRE